MAPYSKTLITGGCLCGAIRYEIEGPALQTSLCHCEDCRRASGAPFAAWTFFRAGSLRWLGQKPRTLQFAGRERRFCGDCGSPLEFHDPAYPELCEINTCTLDDPAAFPPTDQCWIRDRLPWLRHLEMLPEFDLTSPLPGESPAAKPAHPSAAPHRHD
jgi:hypothetical protein